MSSPVDGIVPSSPGLLPGALLEGKYQIKRRLGSGGMGVVYEALHLHLRKRVAIKMLAPDLAERDDLIARVVREARAASATGHPNVVVVTDLGWVDRAPFFVMELVEGRDVEATLDADGAMSVADAIEVACQVLDGLQAVHDVGIIHRDLKPSNVMLIRDRRRGLIVKILDFGVSKLSDASVPRDEPDLTRPGAVMGTPRHMAPEQVLAEDTIDHRADIHSVGSLLYTMLAGTSPFAASNPTAIMARVLQGRYDPISTVVPDLPEGIEAVLTRALAVDRDERFSSCEDMRQALLQFCDGSPRTPRTEARDEIAVAEERALGINPDALPKLAAISGTEVDSGTHWPQVEPAPAAARAGTVLSVGDPELELDVPKGYEPGQVPKQAAPPRAPLSIPWGPIAIVLILGALGWAAYSYRGDIEATADELTSTESSKGKPGEVVLLMLDLKPKDAIVFVDGVQHAERPVSIPKTGEYVKLRVEAPGYEPRVVQVEAVASRRMEVRLKRAKRPR